MGILIDSSILIGFERRKLDLEAKILGREDEEFFLSVITVSELLHGVWRAKDIPIRSRRTAFVEGVLKQFPIISIDPSIARIHAQIWSGLESKGIMIGLHDSWLAATCLVHGLTLVTANVREFTKVKSLRMENWGA